MTTSPVPELSGLPLEDIRAIAANAPARDEAAAARAQEHQRALYFASSERGRLASLPVWLAGWQGREPAAGRIELCLFAGAQKWLEPSPAQAAEDEVRKRILLLSAGGATANPLAASLGAGLKVFDLAVERPAPDAAQGPVMSDRECVAAMAFGMEAVAGGIDLLCLGAVGSGGATATAALLAALHGGGAADWAGPSADAAAAERALALHGAHLKDPLEALRRLGGREFAAIAGAILAARMQKVPVLLDGHAGLAAAAVLAAAAPAALDHCLLAQLPPGEPGLAKAAARMGLAPLLDLGLGDGEGAASALAAGLVKNAAAVHSGMVGRTGP